MRLNITKFFVLTCLFFSSIVMNAESIKVYVDGEEISNGSIATSYEVNHFYFGVGALVLEPRVIVEVLEPCHLAVTVENTTPGSAETVQFCWLGNCNDLKKGESLTKEHDFVKKESQNLYIDAVVSDFNRESSYLVSSKVDIVTNRDKQTLFSFDLNMVYLPENFSEVKNITDSEEAPVFYDLNGYQVKNPTKGIYIVRRGEKVYKTKL